MRAVLRPIAVVRPRRHGGGRSRRRVATWMRVQRSSGPQEERLWPLIERLFASHEVAGLAVAVVRGEEVVSRGFGVRASTPVPW